MNTHTLTLGLVLLLSVLTLTGCPGCQPPSTPIQVAAVAPDDGAQNVDVAVTIAITFDLPAVPDSLEVSIDPSVSFAVTWSADARTAYLNPDADLDPDNEYTVTVHDVASTDDGWIEDEYVFSFTTQSSGEGEGEGGNEGEGEGVTEGEAEGEGEPPSSYRQEMRDFVQAISAYAKAQRPGFLIVPQNGEALLTSNGAPGGTPSQDYLNVIDGQGREDVFYGYTADNVPTPAADRIAFLGMLDFAETHGVEALVTDYCSTHSYIDDSYASSAARGYLSFAADSRELDRIPSYPAAPYQANALNISNLAQAENMLYLLNAEPFASRAAYLAALDATNYDLFIIDLFHDETALTPQEVAGLKTKANGGQRLLLAYMSIGEAEDYRYYWQMAWQPGSPSWLQTENPDWEGNYKVRYWDPGWQAIIFGSGNAYLNRILAAGFDGVYLDIIDAYEYFEEQSGEGEGMPEGEGVEEGEGEGTEEGEGEGEGEGIAEGEGEGEPLSSQVTFTTSEQVMVGGYLVNSDTLWRVEATEGALPENVSAALQPLAVNQEGLDEGPIRVSWDGSWYVFSSERFDMEAVGWAGLAVAAGDLSSVASVRTASGLIHGSQPSITNEGTTVVYVGSDGPHDRDIFVTYLEGSVWSAPVALSTDSPFAMHDRPVLSQTGDKVLFNAGDDFDHLLVCEVNIDGSGFRQAITPANAPAGSPASQIFSPSYAPDGSIVFETAWTGGEQIWRLPVGTGANPVLVGATFNNDNSPVVLPDGRIASLWLGHPDGNNGHHVKIMGANGQNSFMLTLPAIPPNFQDIADFGLGAGLWPGESGEGEGEVTGAFYVSVAGDDTGDGSLAHPWRRVL